MIYNNTQIDTCQKIADSFQVLRRYEIKRSLNGFIKNHLRVMFRMSGSLRKEVSNNGNGNFTVISLKR